MIQVIGHLDSGLGGGAKPPFHPPTPLVEMGVDPTRFCLLEVQYQQAIRERVNRTVGDLIRIDDDQMMTPPGDRHPALTYLASLAPSGRRTTLGKLRRVANLLGHPDILTVPWHLLRYAHIAALRTRLQEGGYAPGTVNSILCAIKGVCRAAFNLEQMDAADLERVRAVRPVRGERLPAGRRLTKGELGGLLEACARDETAAGVRDAAILALLYACGLRRSEVSGLNIDSHDPVSGELRVIGKGDKERLLYIDNGAADALADWRLIRGDEPGPLLCPIDKAGRLIRGRGITDQAVYDVLKKRARQAGVRDLKTHDCRRSFLSDLLELNVDALTCAKLAGHASLDCLMRSYDLRGEESKKKAVALLHLPYRRRQTLGTGGREQ